MTWRDRLQPEIILTSPSGQVFTATWKGDSRNKVKRLGVFEYAKIPGALIQRMGSGPSIYPLTFFFDGPDHDLTAASFYTACDDDSGPWVINHPVYGLIELELTSVTEDTQPVDSGNVTVMITEWIESMDGGLLPTVPQIEAEIISQEAVVEEQAAEQFVEKVESLADKIVAFKNDAMNALAIVRDNISRAKQRLTAVRATIENTYRSITNTIQDSVLSVVSLGGEFQLLVELPGQMIDDTSARITFYQELIDNVFNGSDNMVLNELVATSCVIGIVQSVVDANVANREDAVGYMDIISQTFIDVTNRLDAGQTASSGLAIDRQFFSQSQSFNDTALLIAQATQLLLLRSYDLAIAKRFTLTRNRVPLEIAITEGVDLDVFIATNQLKGNDILLVPAGRQVVVYK